jgi:hypothetical protein
MTGLQESIFRRTLALEARWRPDAEPQIRTPRDSEVHVQ